MNIFRKFGAVAFFLIAIFAFTGCRADVAENKSIEMLFPKDSAGVFVLDSYSGENMDYVEKLEEQFPETDLDAKITDWLNEQFSEKDISYEEDVEPIFDDEWMFGASVSVPDNFQESDFQGEDAFDGVDIFIAGKFEEADKVQKLMETIMKRKVYIYKEDGDFQFWTKEDEDFYMARYGKIIFVTNSKEGRDAAVARLTTGADGFVAAVEKGFAGNLGYMFVDGEVLYEFYEGFFGKLYSYAGVDEDIKNRFSMLGDVWSTIGPDEGGTKTYTTVQVNESAGDLSTLVGNPDYRIAFPSKVNGKGVIFYLETSGIATGLRQFVNSFMAGYDAAKNPLVFSESGEGIVSSTRDYYDEFLASLEGSTGATKDELDGLLEVPMAFAVSDSGGFIPTFSFYFQFDPEQAEIVKKLTQALDVYMDKVIVEFDALMVDAEVPTGAFKKDLELVNGGGLHKLYLDWNSLPEKYLAQANLIPGLNLTDQKIEFYYGVTGNDVFVLSLYPDFPESYGVDVLGDDVDFKEALGKVEGNDAYGIEYFATKPVFDIIDRYLEALKSSGFGPFAGEDLASYELYGKQFIGAFKYAISAGRYKDGVLSSDGYVRIKKVEKVKID